MALFGALFWLLGLFQSAQAETCTSTLLHIRHGHRFQGTPKAQFVVESEIFCAMNCVREKYCQCSNLVNNGKELVCELYDSDCENDDKIVKDDAAKMYSILTDEAHNSSVEATENSRVQSQILAETSSVFPATIESTPIQITSSAVSYDMAMISPSSSVLAPFSTSVLQNNLPSVACKKICENNPASADGTYTVFSGTPNAADVFCDMTGQKTGCGGGGWTLVMRTNGQQTTFEYSSILWKNQASYQPDYAKDLDDNHETKASTFWTTSFTQICLGMSYNGKKGWAVINISDSSLYDLIKTDVERSTTHAVSHWKTLISNDQVSLQQNCRIQGVNVKRGGTGVRIGIIATKTCGVNTDYNSRLGFGMKGTSCGQDGTNTCGNDARCQAQPRDQSIKTIGYILVK